MLSGIDRAAASGSTPRAPAQDTTAGTLHDGRARPRRGTASHSGNTHTARTASSVAVMAAACASQTQPCAPTARINPGSASPMRLNTMLSSRKTTVP